MKTVVLELREIKENAEAIIFSVESLLKFIRERLEQLEPLQPQKSSSDLMG